MAIRNSRLQRSRLSAALFAALVVPFAGSAFAQDAGSQPADSQATNLDKVTVTGSLIPITETETATPVTVITAEDIQARGFANVADVLQQSNFATGGVQGSQTSAGFTQGAETVSLFGLPPGYTKFLINGRPMANFPALYNGSDTFNNISGIPIDLVDRIEILPGGQSSLYGSDAIAGVINIILKKRMDGGSVNLRGGTYTEGGGSSFRASIADDYQSADQRFSILGGVQFEQIDPIWGYQRDLTKQFNRNGASAPVASRDFLVYGYKDIGNSGLRNFGYVDLPAEAAGCANVSKLFGGTEGEQFRPGSGEYCGSFYTPGYRTIKNGKESTQAYAYATYDLSDNAQIYGDVLYVHEKINFHVGSNFTWWGTGATFGYFYDPDVDGLVNLQRAFAPEEFGPEGFRNSMSEDKSDAYNATIGIKGTFGSSNWDYDFFGMRTEYKLDEGNFVRWADPINQFFQDRVLGPDLGPDPYFGLYPTFQPDYAAFYSPITAQELASFTGYAHSKSKTTNTMFRAQVTNASLFKLPGGDAGLALAVEGARETWDYNPDPGLLNGQVWGTTAVQGGGERDRYAVTTELRMPVVDMLTATVSGRYDSYDAEGHSSDKPTYALGLEFRPLDSLMFRGKYGTAFRAPTLSDLFMGPSGYYSTATDYYNCQLLGYGPADVDSCPAAFSDRQYFGRNSGNPELDPVNADVWSVGVVWAPTANLGISVDYFDWDIRDEVNTQRANDLTLMEMFCRTGQIDINTPSCQDAISKITRNAQGAITNISTPKINVSQQILRAATVSAYYNWDIGAYGNLRFDAAYTNNLEHTQQLFPGDPEIDLLREPYYSSDPKVKGNASVTWNIDKWSTTLYGNYIGHTPNYRAQVLNSYADPLAGKVGPWTIYNLSVSYDVLDNLSLSVLVNNLLNEMPPKDRSFLGTSGAPYDEYNYNPYGRAMYVEMRYNFGAK